MAHGEGIKQEQVNIAETGELVTKDVGRLRLVSTTEQAISQHRIMPLGHGTEGAPSPGAGTSPGLGLATKKPPPQSAGAEE